MAFRIKSIILWPTDASLPPRAVAVRANCCNIIEGDAGTGKSSLLYIIDYCLGSGRCRVAGDLQQSVNCFGLLLDVPSEQVLIARKSPTIRGGGNICYFTKSANSNIPDSPDKGDEIKLEELKERLLQLVGFTGTAIADMNKWGSVGFRDITRLNFQPQHIVANPETLFFKCDNAAIFEKFTFILPGLFSEELRGDVINNAEIIRRGKLKDSIEEKMSALLSNRRIRREYLESLCNDALRLGLLGDMAPPNDAWPNERLISALEEAIGSGRHILNEAVGEQKVIEAPPSAHSGQQVKEITPSPHFRANTPKASAFEETLSSSMKQPVLAVKLKRLLRIAQALGKMETYVALREIARSHPSATHEELEDQQNDNFSKLRELTRRALPVNAYKELEDAIAERIMFYASIMELSAGKPRFDVRHARLTFIDSRGIAAGLANVGSVENWVGYHIALLLAIHELLLKNPNPTVPSFVIIDQISQAFFPAVDDFSPGYEIEKSFQRLAKIYSALDHAIERTDGRLQILVFDRHAPPNLSSLRFCAVAERWGDRSSGLIPAQWGNKP